MQPKTHILHGFYPPVNFILEGLDSADPTVDAMEIACKKNGLLQTIVAGLGLARVFPSLFFEKETLERFKQVRSGDRIIMIDNLHRPIMRAMRDTLPTNIERHCFLWTPVSKRKRNVRRLRERAKVFHLSSFDEHIRLLYPDIKIESSFYRFPPASMLAEVNPEYDCFFIGYEKGRREILQNILNDIQKVGLNPYFKIFQRGEKSLPYLDTLEMVRRSRCIVDVTLSTKGMTLRPLEALFFGKKLITNNPDIMKERLYHPKNVFVWGQDDLGKLHDFVTSPFLPLPDEVSQFYDINSWVRRIT